MLLVCSGRSLFTKLVSGSKGRRRGGKTGEADGIDRHRHGNAGQRSGVLPSGAEKTAGGISQVDLERVKGDPHGTAWPHYITRQSIHHSYLTQNKANTAPERLIFHCQLQERGKVSRDG